MGDKIVFLSLPRSQAAPGNALGVKLSLAKSLRRALPIRPNRPGFIDFSTQTQPLVLNPLPFRAPENTWLTKISFFFARRCDKIEIAIFCFVAGYVCHTACHFHDVVRSSVITVPLRKTLGLVVVLNRFPSNADT
jgi:hypothetical protein